jgi:hypothetical protein
VDAVTPEDPLVAVAQRPGVMPYARVNWRVMWLWSANPAAAAASASGVPAAIARRAKASRRIVR